MQYLGGKHRQSKEIGKHINLVQGGTYWEPFMGGGSVAAAVAATGHFDTMELSDAHTDLILMWQALLDGWTPPQDVSEEEYAALKVAEPSALRGFVGFACSFAAKWFGGYARGTTDNYAATGARSLAKKVAPLSTVNNMTITHRHYTDVEPAAGDVLYLDPPYANTTGYSTGAFDSAAFWTWAQQHAENGVNVFVSEFTAPDGWVPVWSVNRTASAGVIDGRAAKRDVEHLYCWGAT